MEDFSRLDAMIALRLRANGHSLQAVAETIRQCAPSIRQGRAKNEGRDWHRYAERTTAYAFGVAGDVDLAKNDVAGFSIELNMQHGVLRRSFTVFGVRFDVCKFLSGVTVQKVIVVKGRLVNIVAN